MARREEIQRTGGNGRRSVCVAHNGLIYTSGITTVDLAADITGQTDDVLRQIDRLLQARGVGKDRVLNAHITLRSMEDYGAFNAVWDAWVTDGFEPCRSVVQGGLALDEYRVKISVTAAL